MLALVACLAVLVPLCAASHDQLTAHEPSAAGVDLKPFAQSLLAAEADGVVFPLNRDATIGGPDEDRDGLRDDIQAWIKTLRDTPAQKAALRQEARSIQTALLVDVRDAGALRAAADAQLLGAVCTTRQYGLHASSLRAEQLERMTVNTENRFLAYGRYNQAVTGRADDIPEGDPCVR